MIASFEFETSAAADLQALWEAIARSPIVVRQAAPPAADWSTIRQSLDADAFILAWIASHVRSVQRHLDS
jgi:hypothetical protein